MNKIDLSYVPLLAVAATAVIALINYFNYRLNKTLNIQNHLHAEKLKIYRELVKLISDMITLHNNGAQIAAKTTHDDQSATRIREYADTIDAKGLEIDALIIEAYLLVPDIIVEQLRKFSEFLHQPVSETGTLESLQQNILKAEQLFRDQAEELIELFREDIGTRRLNQKLTRL